MSSHRLVFTCGVVAAALSAGAWQAVAAFPLTATVRQQQGAEAQPVEAPREPGPRRQINADGALRVGGAVKTPKKIRDVRPVYPAEARDAGVSGVVILEVRIGPDGEVEDAVVRRSIPMLDEAALDAVRQWTFTPTLLNGQPVPVVMTVTVNFTLQKDAGTVTPARRQPKVVHEVKPRYPPDAMSAKISGTVEVEATVGTDGTVTDVRVLRSIAGLDEAAMDAVRQWRFEPLPQPVAVQIELSFTQKSDR